MPLVDIDVMCPKFVKEMNDVEKHIAGPASRLPPRVVESSKIITRDRERKLTEMEKSRVKLLQDTDSVE